MTLPNGQNVTLIEHEHTVTVRGYDGGQLLTLDPFDGSTPAYEIGAFAEGMRLFDDPAIALTT